MVYSYPSVSNWSLTTALVPVSTSMSCHESGTRDSSSRVRSAVKSPNFPVIGTDGRPEANPVRLRFDDLVVRFGDGGSRVGYSTVEVVSAVSVGVESVGSSVRFRPVVRV